MIKIEKRSKLTENYIEHFAQTKSLIKEDKDIE